MRASSPKSGEQPAPPAHLAASIGIVLIAHGSRVPDANQDLYAVADSLRSQGWPNVCVSFLELAEPGIVAAGDQCAARGARQVVLAPYFLSAGRHAAQDLERARRELAQRHPAVDFRLAAPLGPHRLLTDILAERISAALV